MTMDEIREMVAALVQGARTTVRWSGSDADDRLAAARAALLGAVEGIVRERDEAKARVPDPERIMQMQRIADGHAAVALACHSRAEAAEAERDLYRRQVEVRYGKAEEQIERLTLERDAALTALRNGSTIQAEAVARIVDKDRDQWRDLVRLAEQERNEAVKRAEHLLSERDAASATAQRIAERLTAAETALAAMRAHREDLVDLAKRALAFARGAEVRSWPPGHQMQRDGHKMKRDLISKCKFLLDGIAASPPPAALSTETDASPTKSKED